jgi:uncharacterized membrane protein YraQ (UPF0718 family)
MSDPLADFSEWLIYSLLGLSRDSKLASAFDFFLYDSIKILVLLFAMVFVMGIIRTYISPARIRKFLSRKVPGVSNLFASFFGAITPFCSCSSIPIFVSFLEAGVPAGVSLSFLATSPLVNEYVAILMLGFFGWKITLMYVLAGIILGTLAGILLGRFSANRHLVEDIVFRSKEKNEKKFNSLGQRFSFGFLEAKDVVSRLWIWVLVGVGIGALIHGFVPEETINSLVSGSGLLAVPLAVLVGIPIYANCSAVVPIAAVLFTKGVPLGTSLSFMMAVAALSLPEAIILRRVMMLPLLIQFFGIVTLGIILIGYLFNVLGMF